MSNKDQYQPETMEDVEAEDELFGEVIEQSDAQLDSVNVMQRSDLSESSEPAPHGSTIQLAQQRKSAHSGVEDGDRPVTSTPSKSGSGSGIGLTILLAVLVIGGLYLLTMGGDDDPTPSDKATSATATQTTGDELAAREGEEPEESAPEPDEAGDGTPTLDAKTVIKGMVAAGWRVGEPDVAKVDELKQTNVLAHKGESAATITIYEAKTWELAKGLLVETEPPARAISFGRTTARVSLGPPDQQNGVVEMMDALTDLKKAAEEKTAPSEDDASP